MQDWDDIALLREYVERNSEAAFSVLVTRHIDRVYSVALRHTGNPSHAEEITQAVFVILAGKAHRLRKGVILEGWLYRTARLTALTQIRSEIRRTRREQEVHMQSVAIENAGDPWPQINPLLDAALADLAEADRNAVVLRFFYGKSMKEIGAALGKSEDTARMRINRAIERLRRYFSRHGVTSTSAAIAAALTTRSVEAAPSALAGSVTAVAMAKGASAGGPTLALVKGALKLMAWTKAQTIIAAGIVLAVVLGTTTVTVRQIEFHRAQAWREGLDTSALDRVPRQAAIFPALASRAADITGVRFYHGMVMGLNVTATNIVSAAYGVIPARLSIPLSLPGGRYDFISNTAKDQLPALQQQIKSTFGVAGRRELVETNVLVMTLRSRNAPGLKRNPSGGQSMASSNGIFSVSNQPVALLARLLERNFGTPVVDHTGLTGFFDLSWDSTNDGLKNAARESLGVELLPGRERVEFVVMETSN